MKKAAITAGLLLLACCQTAWSDHKDIPWAVKKKIPPPVTGGYSFKIYATPEKTGQETLVDEGAIYISPQTLTESQIAEANDQKYGKVELDDFDYSEHIVNACFAMAHQDPMARAPGDMAKLLWVGGNKDHGYIRIYVWADWWEDLVISKDHGKIAIKDSGGERGWGWKSSRVIAAADPTVNLESCLGYRGSHI